MLGMLHRLVEDPEKQKRFIKFVIPFSIVGSTLATISMILARYYR